MPEGRARIGPLVARLNRVKRLLTATLLLTCAAQAQLVSNPSAVPRTGRTPVVFLNGFETNCPGASFAHAFGTADQVLQANGIASVFFNNCAIPGAPSIEKLGAAFGTFLASLTYEDGQSIAIVDAVSYSMGGLILRSYLSGKQEAQSTFAPPFPTRIRKAVFIATPNFGTPVAGLAFGSGVQADELSSGSNFLMDLNTWNQNHDDLRGIDAIAIAGTGGTGLASRPGFDDGLVPLSSGSLRFYLPGRTRVLPLCHVASPGLLTLTGFCAPNSKGIARVTTAGDDNARIIVSFLTGSAEWQLIGTSAEQAPLLQTGSGILVRARNATDVRIDPSSVVATPASGPAKTLNMSNSEIAYTDLITAGAGTITVSAGAQGFTQSYDLQAGGAQALVIKPGPAVKAVVPAAAVVFPLVVAPRMIVSLYGSGMEQASVTVNGTAAPVLYGSGLQINTVLPADTGIGLARLNVRNAGGSQSINVLTEPAFPAVFSLNPNGDAAALNALTSVIVSRSNPLRAGDYVELFLTGLGTTLSRDAFDWALLQPVVTVGGIECPVTFAGAAPGFNGLDQINCRIPAGLGLQDAAVIVRSGERSSPATKLAVQ